MFHLFIDYCQNSFVKKYFLSCIINFILCNVTPLQSDFCCVEKLGPCIMIIPSPQDIKAILPLFRTYSIHLNSYICILIEPDRLPLSVQSHFQSLFFVLEIFRVQFCLSYAPSFPTSGLPFLYVA